MEDHLDKATSVSLELTESGVKAKAKSRFVAAVDRFGGNLVESRSKGPFPLKGDQP